MTEVRDWLEQQGFLLFHTPGISRAWRCPFLDGSYLLVTDAGGFDLPEPGGPYSAAWLSPRDDLIEEVSLLWHFKDLYDYWRRCRRVVRRRINSTPSFPYLSR